jgi:hypothetical protein
MKRRWRLITLIATTVACTGLLAASQVLADASLDRWGRLLMENKDPITWEIIIDDTYGILVYKKAARTFKYHFRGRGLEANTEYSLIYYADKPNRFVNWGGDYPGALIATGTTDDTGKLFLWGCAELNMDLPSPPDINHPEGAKIWLVPSDDYNANRSKLEAWNPTEYLFETKLITYDDTDGEMLCLDNKDPATWEPILDDTLGMLMYSPAGPTFKYHFVGRGLEPDTEYSLIYYADPWPGNHPGALIATETADGDGNFVMSGSAELKMDLPHPCDANYPEGAKIWLVPSDDYDPENTSLISWNPEQYLFECFLIKYHYTPLVDLDYVDIGELDSEVSHHLRGWGPIEPETSGGAFGGIDDCRVTWEPGAPDTLWGRAAVFMMKVPPGFVAKRLKLNVLDGLADDSFAVYVRGKRVYSHTGRQTGTEDWITHTIDLDSVRCARNGRIWVLITATGPAWSGFNTYGQLAVDEARLLGCEK